MQLRPKRMREAAALWETIGSVDGAEARDAKWGHPDLLPKLPGDDAAITAANATDATSSTSTDAAPVGSKAIEGTTKEPAIDWDAELSKLLGEDPGDDADSNLGDDDSGDSDSDDDKPTA
jgi:hypothetical protein